MSILPIIAALSLAVPTPQATQVPAVAVEPAHIRLEVDATRRLTFGPSDKLGSAVVRWVSRTPEIVSVDETGTVRALKPGTGHILAIAGEHRSEAVVVVAPLPPSRIDIRLGTSEVFAGTGIPIHVSVTDRQGTVLRDARLHYETAAAQIATVDGTGRLLAHAPGTTAVRVIAGNVRAEAQLRVVANPIVSYRLTGAPERVRTGDVVRLRVTGVDRAGREIASLQPAWSVEGPAGQIAAENGEGVFVAEQPGRHIITAYLGPQRVERSVIDVDPRTHDGEFVRLGHGLTAGHHAGDTWAFEGTDGRDYALIGTFMHDWAKMFDITDPTNPVLTDSVKLDARRINDVKIHPNNRIGILTREGASSRRNGIVILDLSTPAHPTIISEFTETVPGGVHNVWIDGPSNLVYAVHNGTRDIRIIDIADPKSPREVGRWSLPNENRSLHDVIVQDGYAYLSYWDDGLIMLDVGAGSHGGSPRDPKFVSQFKYPAGHTHTAWRSGKYLFIGDEIFPSDWNADRPIDARGYIHVVDYTDPEKPVEVARYEVPDAGAHNFWVEDDLLYVGYYQAGLRIVDVSGELRGDLFRQGREISSLRTSSPDAITPNWSMTWGAQLFKGNIITSDLNSGLWLMKFQRRTTTF